MCVYCYMGELFKSVFFVSITFFLSDDFFPSFFIVDFCYFAQSGGFWKTCKFVEKKLRLTGGDKKIV